MSNNTPGGGNPTVGGKYYQINGVDPVEPVDPFINQLLNATSDDNDNSQTTLITSNTLDHSQLPDELGPGRYYLENLTLTQATHTLDLNTTNGDITLVVRDYMEVRNGGELNVTGDGTVQVFLAARDTTTQNIASVPVSEHHFLAYHDATISTPYQRSPQLQIFGPSYFNGSLKGSGGKPVQVEGIIYAPAGSEGPGNIFVRDAHVFGGIAAGQVDGENKAEIHFDMNILGTQLDVFPGSRPPRIDFLHVTKRQINVTSDSPD